MSPETYLVRRKIKASIQSVLFYINRVFPIKTKKIVFTNIEGTLGYACNPKYIAKELISRYSDFELVWLVDDLSKAFPSEIRKVKNTLFNRAYELSTAGFWIDNSRKQLECRKRKGQIYIQTWHAQLAIKPIGLQRGNHFPAIAYNVSKHDSDMIDYFTSNSKWFTNQLPEGHIYNGKVLKTGSCRCDVLINERSKKYRELRKQYGLTEDCKILMYCPTFRSGSMETTRSISVGNAFPDFDIIISSLVKRFSGNWVIMLRLHPQLTARGISVDCKNVIDISRVDDSYEILAGVDCFLSDYSASSFDAAIMKIPVFLYMKDYKEYVEERGNLVWSINELPFSVSFDNKSLATTIEQFDESLYKNRLDQFFDSVELFEDGKASKRLADFIETKFGEINK